VEGVWGNREVPPADLHNLTSVRKAHGPVEGVWGNREVPPADLHDLRRHVLGRCEAARPRGVARPLELSGCYRVHRD
jgi:hypothetical protein